MGHAAHLVKLVEEQRVEDGQRQLHVPIVPGAVVVGLRTRLTAGVAVDGAERGVVEAIALRLPKPVESCGARDLPPPRTSAGRTRRRGQRGAGGPGCGRRAARGGAPA